MKIWSKIKRYPNIGLVLLAYIAFIALGMPDGLLGAGRANLVKSLDLELTPGVTLSLEVHT